MKKFISILLVCIMLCSNFAGIVYAEGEKISARFLYVATDGSDSADGSASAPFASLQKAVEAARGIKDTVVINMKGGEYRLYDTISLTSADNNLVIRAVPGEAVTITGGTKIKYEDFVPETDKELLEKIILGSARSKIITADLKALGIEKLGEIANCGFNITSAYAPTLTFNDRYLTLAQYPNGDDYVYTGDIIDNGAGKDKGANDAYEVKYKIRDSRYTKWGDAKDVWAVGWYVHDWADSTTPAVIDTETGIITSSSGYADIKSDRRVRFFNLFEELDDAGEYYIDRETGKLYVIAPEGFGAGKHVIFSAHDKDFITLDSCENITIQGIRFEGTAKHAITGTACRSCVVDDCEFTAIGDTAVEFYSDSRDCVIKNCYIHDIGSGGARVAGGVAATLERGNNVIDNCHVERFMQYKLTYAPAVTMNDSGVGNKISHCEINDGPHEGVAYTGAFNIFEYNEIYRVCTDTADSGAIYTGRNWLHRNNEIRYNYFHDLTMIDTTTGMEMQAVYLDDMHSSTAVYGNVFYRCDSVALYGGGRRNTFENNIMLECAKPFVFDARGTTGGVWASMVETMIERAKSIPHTEGVWAEQIPDIVNLLEDDPQIPKYNVVKNNLTLRTPEMEFADPVVEYSEVEQAIEVSKDDFADYKNKNFALKEDSEIFTKLPEFKNIPFDEIGTYEYTAEDKWIDNGAVSENSDEIKVLLNGEKIDFADVEPQIINDRTMVPLRAIFEALGAEVAWDDATKTVTAVKEDVTIKMAIGADSFTRNGESVSLDSPATIVDSRTLVPVRAIAESFGSEVGWIGETRTVTITD